MTTVRKTRSGWVREITDTVYGSLKQGGICGREELYTRATLAARGVDYDADPDGHNVCESVSDIDWLAHVAGCDQVLRQGHIIR
jgi:hypothetical protein